MFIMVEIVNTVLYIWKLLRVNLKSSLLKKKKTCNYVQGWVLTRLIMVIISQYIQISNHYVVYLKLICYMSIISQLKLINNYIIPSAIVGSRNH